MNRRLAALLLAVPLAIAAFTGCSSGLLGAPAATQKPTSQKQSPQPEATSSTKPDATGGEEPMAGGDATTAPGGKGGDWPAVAKSSFMSSCTGGDEGGKAAYCQCSLDELQNRYGFQEFSKIVLDAGGDASKLDVIKDIALGCVSKLK